MYEITLPENLSYEEYYEAESKVFKVILKNGVKFVKKGTIMLAPLIVTFSVNAKPTKNRQSARNGSKIIEWKDINYNEGTNPQNFSNKDDLLKMLLQAKAIDKMLDMLVSAIDGVFYNKKEYSEQLSLIEIEEIKFRLNRALLQFGAIEVRKLIIFSIAVLYALYVVSIILSKLVPFLISVFEPPFLMLMKFLRKKLKEVVKKAKQAYRNLTLKILTAGLWQSLEKDLNSIDQAKESLNWNNRIVASFYIEPLTTLLLSILIVEYFEKNGLANLPTLDLDHTIDKEEAIRFLNSFIAHAAPYLPFLPQGVFFILIFCMYPQQLVDYFAQFFSEND